VFPAPPDEPRIQYLTSFGLETDLGGGSKVTNFLIGQQRPSHFIWKPYGLAMRDGKVYVCDTQLASISVSDLRRRKMRDIAPEGLAAMRLPVSVAVDERGQVYVSDTVRGQVLIYDQQDHLVEALGKKDEMKPCGLALAGDRLYVTDLKSSSVRVYSKAGRQLLFQIPRGPVDEKSRLYQPTNLAVDPGGRVCVSDTGGFCVKVYDLEGNHLRTVGDMGVAPGQFALPKGLAVDRQGRIYVIDAAAAVVQIFDAEGRLLMFFGDARSSGEAGLYLPAAITISYDDLNLFEPYLAPGCKLEYVILVTNQAGPHKVSAYGFLKRP
jgi:DNA-binding beta-propeller fold protein YncE